MRETTASCTSSRSIQLVVSASPFSYTRALHNYSIFSRTQHTRGRLVANGRSPPLYKQLLMKRMYTRHSILYLHSLTYTHSHTHTVSTSAQRPVHLRGTCTGIYPTDRECSNLALMVSCSSLSRTCLTCSQEGWGAPECRIHHSLTPSAIRALSLSLSLSLFQPPTLPSRHAVTISLPAAPHHWSTVSSTARDRPFHTLS